VTRTARCACKAAAITVEGEPQMNGICHCRNCQRRSGSAFGWSTYFPDSQILSVEGDLAAYDLKIEPPQTRHFCRICGTTLYWKSGFMPESTGIAGGCFCGDLPDPTFTSHGHTACAWVTLPEAWPRA